MASADTILDGIFRYSLLFGLTTHLYDRKKHQLVHSSKAQCYAVSLHIAALCLLVVFYNSSSDCGDWTERRFIEQQFLLLAGVNFTSILSSIISQWTARAKAAALFNEAIQMWHEDMAQMQWTSRINRQAARLFTFRTMSTALIVVNTVFGCFWNKPLSAVQSVCLFVLCNIIVTVMFQFSCGIIFCDYLFRVLNWNLSCVVEDLNCLRYRRSGSRFEIEELDRELSSIGRIHTRLQKWVMRFKNLYQIELLCILLTVFSSQIFTLFLLCSVLNAGSIDAVLAKFLIAAFTSVLCGLDLMLHFFTCGRLLEASNSAVEILKSLPSYKLPSILLERSIEMMCLELNHDKLRLSVCGLVDLHWGTGFAMTEAAMMCIILLIQIDYDNF